MSSCRRQFRVTPKTTSGRLKAALDASLLTDAVDMIEAGEASPQLICACAWHALEAVAAQYPEDELLHAAFKDVFLSALTAALELLESQFPGDCEFLLTGRHSCSSTVGEGHCAETRATDEMRIPPKSNTDSAPSRTPFRSKPNGSERSDAVVLLKSDEVFGFRSTSGGVSGLPCASILPSARS